MADSNVPPYEDVSTAPTVFFDIVACNGVLNGVIEIELAQRILVPVSGDQHPKFKFVTSGRLRCSPVAAQQLITALDQSLKS
jgi:hypothetical protein